MLIQENKVLELCFCTALFDLIKNDWKWCLLHPKYWVHSISPGVRNNSVFPRVSVEIIFVEGSLSGMMISGSLFLWQRSCKVGPEFPGSAALTSCAYNSCANIFEELLWMIMKLFRESCFSSLMPFINFAARVRWSPSQLLKEEVF